MEVWKSIKNYEGLYEVSNLGRVRSLDREVVTIRNGKEHIRTYKSKIIKYGLTTNGYCFVHVSKNGKTKSLFTHRIVAQAFIPNQLNKPEVNHIDGNKKNNRVDNLEWSTPSENIQHSYDNGLSSKGEKRYNAKLTNEQVNFIKENYVARDKLFGATALAKRFGVSIPLVTNVGNNKAR